jgi:hypothetical protein
VHLELLQNGSWKRLITVVIDQGREEGSPTAVDRLRRAVGTYPAVATGPASTWRSPWAQAPGRPESAVRHPVRPVHGHSVGVPASRTRVRLRHDLLAAAAGLERRRSLDTAAREPAGRAARGGRAGLVAGGDRRLTPAGHEGRPKIRTEPGRPCANWLETSPDHRSARHPVAGAADRRQPQRRQPSSCR